jgi:hypothetical protein
VSAWRQSVILRRPGSPGRRRILPRPFAGPSNRTARFFAALRMTAVGRVVPRQSSRAKSPGRAPAYVMLALLLASPAFGQAVDVTASLDITDGWARVGAYVPVTLKVTNRTDKEIAEVFVATGGPVDVRSDLRLATGETAEKVLPVFYVGGDLPLRLEFLAENGTAIFRTPVTPQARALPDDMALVAIEQAAPQPGEVIKERIAQGVGARRLHMLRLNQEAMVAALRCGVVTAAVTETLAVNTGRAALVRRSGGAYEIRRAPFPLGADHPVQPHLYRLLVSGAGDSARGLRLWLCLGLLCLGVLVMGCLIPPPRSRVAVLVLLMVAITTTGSLWVFGGLRWERLRQAQVYYARVSEHRAGLEDVRLLQSRGGAALQTASWADNHLFPFTSWNLARDYADQHPNTSEWPVPVFASSQDMLRQRFILCPGAIDPLAQVSDTGPQPVSTAAWSHTAPTSGGSCPTVMLRTFLTTGLPFDYSVRRLDRTELDRLDKRPDLIQALLVEGSLATDPTGRTQPLDAWTIDWKRSTFPDIAFVGRSLKWWAETRQEGDGPFLLTWWHQASEPRSLAWATPFSVWRHPSGTEYECLPALVVTSEAPKQN